MLIVSGTIDRKSRGKIKKNQIQNFRYYYLWECCLYIEFVCIFESIVTTRQLFCDPENNKLSDEWKT